MISTSLLYLTFAYFAHLVVVESDQWVLSPSQRMLLYERPRDFVRTANASKTSFTDAEKTLLLQLHNAYRSMVQPPAANMRELVWDSDLEEYARQHSQACSGAHSDRSMVKVWSPLVSEPWNYMGENLYWSYGDRYSIEEAMWMFWEEGSGYDINTNVCTHRLTCGHYKVLTLESSWRVGCSINQCNSFTDNPYPGPAMFMTCAYNGMYFPDVRPYTVGEACSGCTRETVGSQFAHCRHRLCVTSRQLRRTTGFDGNTTILGLQHSDFANSHTLSQLEIRDLPRSTQTPTPLQTTARTRTTRAPTQRVPISTTAVALSSTATTAQRPVRTSISRPFRYTTAGQRTTKTMRPRTTSRQRSTLMWTQRLRTSTIPTTTPARTSTPTRATTPMQTSTTAEMPTTSSSTRRTPTPMQTTTPMRTSTARPTTTPMRTSTANPTTTPMRTSTARPTTTPMRTSTARPTTTPMRTSTARPTTTPMRTSTSRPRTTPMSTTRSRMRTSSIWPPTTMRSPFATRTSQMRPSTSQMRPSTSQMRPSTSQMRPSTSQMRPSTSQIRPTTPQRRPTTSHLRTTQTSMRGTTTPRRATPSTSRATSSRQRTTSATSSTTTSTNRSFSTMPTATPNRGTTTPMRGTTRPMRGTTRPMRGTTRPMRGTSTSRRGTRIPMRRTTELMRTPMKRGQTTVKPSTSRTIKQKISDFFKTVTPSSLWKGKSGTTRSVQINATTEGQNGRNFAVSRNVSNDAGYINARKTLTSLTCVLFAVAAVVHYGYIHGYLCGTVG